MSKKTTDGDSNIMALPMKVKGEPNAGSITPAQIMEQVLLKGDLKNLSEAERARYYTRVCESIGLNPLTQPFQYITLNGKLTLYANKDCAAQLRKLHEISVESIDLDEIAGVYLFKCKVKAKDGRTDVGTGAVNVKGLVGEGLANQIMKGETKAKRRATLSICGLGFLDETEIEDIPVQRNSSAEGKRDGSVKRFEAMRREVATAPDLETLRAILADHSKELDVMPSRWIAHFTDEFILKWGDLGGNDEDCPMLPMEERG